MNARRATFLAVLLLAFGRGASAQELVADLTSHLVAITTGFNGAQVVLFGATAGEGDVVVVVRGPDQPVTVRRKDRVAGVWLNRHQVTFPAVPTFYSVASGKPLADIASDAVLERLQIGLDHLALAPAAALSPDETAEFRAALVRTKTAGGLFSPNIGRVSFLGNRLFRATVSFPSNVPIGNYQVSVFLLRNGEVVSAQTTPLLVSQAGISADLVEFAGRQRIAYALVAIAIAVAFGWAASVAFRRT